jgi:hypothetical protein
VPKVLCREGSTTVTRVLSNTTVRIVGLRVTARSAISVRDRGFEVERLYERRLVGVSIGVEKERITWNKSLWVSMGRLHRRLRYGSLCSSRLGEVPRSSR